MHSERQMNLFASEISDHVLTAFTDLHFQSYDYETIRNAMVEYVVRNFPEDFNDYIESSEFVAIIELLAYLGQSLAFRLDMNTRENFIGSATRKDSVLKLAKMLNYSPQRSLPATGLLRLHSVSTTEGITSSGGVNLRDRTVIWDDPDNEDYYEQILAIMNASFVSTNQFGTPFSTGDVAGIHTEIYNINVARNIAVTYNFSANINGTTRPFEIVGAVLNDNGFVVEQIPDPTSAFSIAYLNSGLGNSSDNTGFFVHFRQGELSYTDYQFPVPLPNREIDLDIININQSDIFLQEITPSGLVKTNWTEVPAVEGTNVIYNALSRDVRDVYAVETQIDDKIRIRFSDGNFGNTPLGLYRLWYRTSANIRMQIRPEDMNQISVNIPYLDAIGNPQTLTMTLSLNYSVSNSVPSETRDEIRSRASALYYTQNRAITMGDYNVFPLISDPDIKKIRAINRTHAGHSRSIDINDPTGSTQNLTVHADDGIIYKNDENVVSFIGTAASLSSDQLIKGGVEPLLSKSAMTNFFYDTYTKAINTESGSNFLFFRPNERIRWTTKPATTTSSTGYFVPVLSYDPTDILANEFNAKLIGVSTAGSRYELIKEKSLLELQHPDSLETIFVSIENIESGGNPTDHAFGAVRLSSSVVDGFEVIKFYPQFRRILNFEERILIAQQIDLENNFGIGYDYTTSEYYIIAGSNIDVSSSFSLQFAHSLTSSNQDASWLLSFEYISAMDEASAKYEISSRTLGYNFESAKQVRFFFVNDFNVLDVARNISMNDEIVFHPSNTGHRSPIQSVTVDSTPTNLQTSPIVNIISDGIGRNAEISTSLGISTPGDLLTGGYYPGYTGGAFEVSSKMSTSAVHGTPGFITLTGGTFHDPNNPKNRNAIVSALLRSTSAIPTAKEVYSLIVEDTGWGYATAPDISFTDVGQIVSEVALNNGGGGYSLGDVLTVDGAGYAGTPATVTVDGEAAGLITAISLTTQGLYTTNPTVLTGATVSGGTGTGATINITMLSAAATRTASSVRMFVNDIIIDNAGFWYGPLTTAISTETSLLLTANLYSSYNLNRSIKFNLAPAPIEDDGYIDPKRVILTFTDDDNTGTPDNPNIFDLVVAGDILVFETYRDYDGYTYFRYNGDLTYDSGVDDIKLDSVTIATYDTGIKRYLATDGSGTEYKTKVGRAYSESDPLSYVWRHFAPRDHRIDPSITNLIEIMVLTKTYHDAVISWVVTDGSIEDFPKSPTTNELRDKMILLESSKAMSDQLMYRSVSFLPLFGERAAPELRAKFKAVKMPISILTDNEIKSRIAKAINDYFDISLWEFGDSFYYTELATYIHQQLSTHIGSVVLVPTGPSTKFGNLFQIRSMPNEIFLNVATINDIEIVSDLTEQVLRTN